MKWFGNTIPNYIQWPVLIESGVFVDLDNRILEAERAFGMSLEIN